LNQVINISISLSNLHFNLINTNTGSETVDFTPP
jgi:hypothetical protein